MKSPSIRPRAVHLAAIAVLVMAFAAPPAVLAAQPPGLLNYQGVLRDAAGVPVSGSRGIVVRFFDSDGGGCPAAGGTLLLTDAHAAVTISGGLFNLALGGGVVTPGAYPDLASVFGGQATVFLEVQVEAETLCPRVRVISAAYALNAAALGGRAAGEFLDTSAADQLKTGGLVLDTASYGVMGLGPAFGGLFSDKDSGAFAYVAVDGDGIQATGSTSGGYFWDSNNSGWGRVGVGEIGIQASGNGGGGEFTDPNNSGRATVALGDLGILAYGNAAGGHLYDADSSSGAWIGVGNYGVDASGNYGGKFTGTVNLGVQAAGFFAGGSFVDTNQGGSALLGYANFGVEAWGSETGGHFYDSDSSGDAYVGDGDRGIVAVGNTSGALLYDLDSTGEASVASGDRGIWAKGTFAGGTFSHPNNVSHWADVSTPFQKIVGTGAVSFVQNHPYDRDRVIVYGAPEGDEAAVYTRGSARLVDGVARVKLGPTFPWVANPDLGLTAHLTPRDAAADLWVESIASDELVVRGPAASSAAFDYLVFGLRIGFEEMPVVRPKTREAFLPPAAAFEEAIGGDADLRAFSAGERFERTRADLGARERADRSRSRALAAAIDAGRVEVVAQADAEVALRRGGEAQRRAHRDDARVRLEAEASPVPAAHHPEPRPAILPQPEGRPGAAPPPAAIPPVPLLMAVSEAVEEGDLLVVDLEHPGELRRADAWPEPAVVAIAAGPAQASDGRLQAPVANDRYAFVKADASHGTIRPGDLLTTSPTPGHAMRLPEGSAAGPLVGRALERLDAGTGLVRVLVLLR